MQRFCRGFFVCMHMHTIFFNWKMDIVHLILRNWWGVRPYKPASKYSYLCKFPCWIIPSLSKKYLLVDIYITYIYNVHISFYFETPYNWAVYLLTVKSFLSTPKIVCFCTYCQHWNGNLFHMYCRFKSYFRILAVKVKKFR